MEKQTTTKTTYKITPEELQKKLGIKGRVVFAHWDWDSSDPFNSTKEYLRIETDS